jgi:hypothetical protein
MKTEFAPQIRSHGPQANSGPDHLGTVTIEEGDRRIDVKLYADGLTRFQINQPDVLIEEAFLPGNKPGAFAIIGVRPRALVTPRA